MTERARVLVVDDSEDDAILIAKELRRYRPIEFERVEDEESLRAALRAGAWDLILSDWSMPRLSGLHAIQVARQVARGVPIVVVSGSIGEELAVTALRAGARDFLRKEHLSRLGPIVERELLERGRRDEDLAAERARGEAHRAALVEHALDAIIGMDHLGRITEFNPAAEAVLGYPRVEVLGRSLADAIIPARLRESHRKGLAEYEATAKGPIVGKRIELTAMHKDGSEIPVELSVNRIGLDEPPAFVGFLRDISERKRSEAAIADRIRVATLTARVGVVLARGGTLRELLQGCAEALVEELGAAFARIWTLSPDRQMLELRASAGMYTHTNGPHGKVRVGELKIGRIAEERRPHLTNDVQNDPRVGDPAWARREGMIAFAGHPLLAGGELLGVMALFARRPLAELALKSLSTVADAVSVGVRGKLADQTREALEDQLRQSQKMEAIGRLAGGIAHDFNNTLSVVLSCADMVSDSLQPGDPLREEVVEIRRAGQRAADLTAKLLSFSRQQVVHPKILDLNKVLADMRTMLTRVLGEDVDLAIVTRASHCVRIDPTSLDKVIMNLAINARDAMPTGGKLTIEAADVMLDQGYALAHVGVTAGPYVMLAVTDTGIGMDDATKALVFEPFFTTKRTGEGTGLGLSTVFGIVRQSGGTVWTYSEPGKGSTFKVYLPCVEGASDPASQKVDATGLRGSETVLIVEDEEQVRLVVRGILRRQGYNVIEARSGGEALLVCEQSDKPIHLLLTDVVMPRMSGPELAKVLGRSRPEMRVLCMSGYTDGSVVRHGLLEGEIAFLQKPITPQALARKVREVLDADTPPIRPCGE